MRKTIIMSVMALVGVVANGASRYIGFYTNKIVEVDTGKESYNLSAENFFANEDETFIIQTIAETVDEERSKNIKKSHFWAGFSAATMGLAAMNTSYYEIKGDALGTMRGYHYMNVSMDNIHDCVRNVRDNESLAITLIYMNNSDKEISISYNGRIFYILPHQSMVCDYVNKVDTYIRVQTDLNDANSAKRYIVSAVASCKKVKIEYETEQYVFGSYDSGKLNIAKEPIMSYCIYNKEDGNCQYMIKSKLEERIKEEKKK